VGATPCFDGTQPFRRMTRAAMMASASTMVMLASCSAYGQGPICGDDVTTFSSCGLMSATTTCAGATQSCTTPTQLQNCTWGPITTNCEIDLVLGDGTSQTIQVTVKPAPAACTQKFVVATTTNTFFDEATCPNVDASSPD
jgi:hypothetical protein